MENQAVKQNLSSKSQWLRILYMVLFAVVLYLVMMLVAVVTVVQALFSLISGKPNKDIGDFANDLSTYVYRIVAFLTYSDDRRPFPFNNWEDETVSSDDKDDDEYASAAEEMGDAGQPGGDKRNTTDQ
ncbi:DUF4389 domain-containing protein [Methylophaga sp.]|uniref:DUF4389 domain-containing protein n=1 Tax=Methylophaga sp. TaxID=2024840 RepID=UPI003F6A0529